MNINLLFDNFDLINVFDINISQEEDCFARAQLLVRAVEKLPPPGVQGVLKGSEIYFTGYLAAYPVHLKGNFRTLELVACPLDFSQQVEKVQYERRVAPYWDPLWVKDVKNIREIQDAHPSSVYCDRRTGEVKWSDWFEGRDILDLQDNFFKESLECQKGKPPLRSCTVNVHAHWIQKEEGVENIGAAIRRAFKPAYMNTYTKEALVQKWPEAGQRMGRSGVWVVKSKLEEISPPGLPRYSPPLRVEEGEGEKAYRARRYWLKPTLWVRWLYQQRRKETLTVTLSQNFHQFPVQEGREKTLEVTLQNINPEPQAYPWAPQIFYREGAKVSYKKATYRCKKAHRAGLSFEEDKWELRKHFYTPLGNPARASFFLTERGYQAAEHAIERAKAALARSARAFFVSFEAPWEAVKDITTDTTVFLKDERLPGGRLKGKVIRYALILRGETLACYGQVTLACSVGVKESSLPQPIMKEEGPYCEASYIPQEPYLRQTASGMGYYRYDECAPPQRSRAGSLLREVKLIHGPEEQEATLGAETLSLSCGLERALSRCSTRVQLYFKDLRTREVLEHVIPLRMESSWSAPQHIF